MSVAVREHTWPVVLSVLLHAALAAGLVLMTMVSITHAPTSVQPIPINAVVVDSQVLRAAQRAEAERAAEEAQRARAAAEAARASAEQAHAAEAAKAEAQAKALEEKKAADAAAVVAAKQALQAKQAAEAKEAAEAKAAADAKSAEAKQAADAKRAAEERAQLRRQMAEEEHVRAVEASPLRDRYIASLRNSIQNAWIKPSSARVGIDCRVVVTQIPGGEVTNAHVTQCNGDAAVRQSIENAVYKASPLPDPPDPALFQKSFVIEFKPDE